MFYKEVINNDLSIVVRAACVTTFFLCITLRIVTNFEVCIVIASVHNVRITTIFYKIARGIATRKEQSIGHS